MSEQENDAFEERSRALFQDSVDGLDLRMRSRLTQARSAALEAAAAAAAILVVRLADAGHRRRA